MILKLLTEYFTLVENVMSKKAPTIARVTPAKGTKNLETVNIVKI